MDFTDPFTGLTPDRKLTREETLRALRIDLAAELDAINLYQAHIDAIDDERVKEVIAHIRDEEKEHAAEFMAMINFLDDKQREEFAAEHTLAIQRGQIDLVQEEQSQATDPAQTTHAMGAAMDPAQVAGAMEPAQAAGAIEMEAEAAPAADSPDGSAGGTGFTVGSLLGEEQH